LGEAELGNGLCSQGHEVPRRKKKLIRECFCGIVDAVRRMPPEVQDKAIQFKGKACEAGVNKAAGGKIPEMRQITRNGSFLKAHSLI